MKKKILLFLFIFIAQSIPLTWATAPSEMELSYDTEAKNLHIIIKHISKNPRKHYIRRVTVQKNAEEPIEFPYSSQDRTDGFEMDVPLEVKSGDKISVKAICSDAGRKQEILLIP